MKIQALAAALMMVFVACVNVDGGQESARQDVDGIQVQTRDDHGTLTAALPDGSKLTWDITTTSASLDLPRFATTIIVHLDGLEPSPELAAIAAVKASRGYAETRERANAWEDWCFFLVWDPVANDYVFVIDPFC